MSAKRKNLLAHLEDLAKEYFVKGGIASCENCEHAYRGGDPLNIIRDSKYLFHCSAGHGYGGAETVCSDWKMKEGDVELNRLEEEIEKHRIMAIMHKNEARDEWYLHDCLLALKNIQDCGNCNVCASKTDCQYEPRPGQMARYNCPFYKKEGEEK